VAKARDLKGLRPVPALDLAAYASGVWYEQRRLDSWFERDLDYVTAKYRLQDSGFISVTNAGVRRQGGGSVVSRGVARLTDVPGYLLVSFFPLVEGDYVVLYLDDATSVVGSPDRKYLWLLTRTPAVTAAQLSRLATTALASGYTPAQLDSMTAVPQLQQQ
jgi:apolipoprotein D and lipocalin family protein